MKFKSNFFTRNRQNLLQKMNKDSVIILLSNDQYPKNGDQLFLFRQQSDLFYLTGITQEKTTLVLCKDIEGQSSETLFILKPDLKLETWEGKKLTKHNATTISGIESISWNASLDRGIMELIKAKTNICLLGEDAFSQTSLLNLKHISFEKKIKNRFPKNRIESPRQAINQLRLIKSKDEIAMMQEAVNITNIAFKRVLQTVKPRLKEFEIEAEISYVFRKNGASGHAYEPIIASGENACSLHYVQNNSILKDEDLLLMDFGADFNYYAADLSRTIPVNGKFSSRQKKLYQLVLDIQKKAIALFVPGNTINFVNKKVNDWMTESLMEIGLLKNPEDLQKYYPHGTSHFLGIDVHDVGTKEIEFEKGMVLTCEPGLYIKEESIGIRIENDIIVADPPIDLMSETIREIDEIEKVMK